MELRACVGADAARRAAERASAAQRAEIVARAEALAAATGPRGAQRSSTRACGTRSSTAPANVAYRLALNTLNAGQHVLILDAEQVAAELGDDAAIRALAGAIATREPDRARALAAELLERSVPA